MRALLFAIVMLYAVSPAAVSPADAQVVTLRATVESQSAQYVTLRLHSGERVRVPLGDVVNTPLSGSKTAESVATTQTARSLPLYDWAKQCAREWPSDDFMQTTCKREQQEAFAVLTARSMTGHEREAIRGHCSNQYPTNYRLRNFCEEEELRALQSKNRSGEASRPDRR